MARWRLTAPHYLNLLGSASAEWEYSEIDRTTGRPKKHKFKVPALLEPDDKLQWTHHEGPNNEFGFIVVAHEGTGDSRDLEFVGDPTPEMLPLDDEARAISDTFAKKWDNHTALSERSYGDVIIEGFQKQMADLQAAMPAPQIQGVDKLLEAMTAMMQQNQQLINTLAAGTRR